MKCAISLQGELDCSIGYLSFVSHASCSRAHAAIMFHKVLKKAFVVDLKSAHGTFIGYRRLEPHVPIQLPADVQLRIGASTRRYVFKNKPLEKEKRQQEIELPEEEEDLDNLTEYNTARNKKIVQMVSLAVLQKV